VNRAPSERVDCCVVGAGPAGALVAERLASAGRDVVVLEAGPRFDSAEREERMETYLRPTNPDIEVWEMGGPRDAYASSGRFYPLNATRVKGVGGSTLHWQGMVMRLHEEDFNLASETGLGVDWPIDYSDLRPYYAEAESALGVAGAVDNPFAPPREEPFPMPAFPPSKSDAVFAEACEAAGITTHSVPNARNSKGYDGRSACVGYGTCSPVCPSGAKYDATTTIADAEEAGARVMSEVPVQRLEHDDAGERVTGAVYATPEGDEFTQEAREFVLACGGVETPRLLLLSDSSRFPDGLANSSGAVGRYFMDHLFAGMGGRVAAETNQHEIGFITTESHQFYDRPDDSRGAIKLEFLNYAGPSPVGAALTDGEWGDELAERVREAYGNHVAMGGLVEQLPRAENRVRLHPTKTDNRGNPVPEIVWSLGEKTRRTIERANELQRSVFDELGVEPEWVTGPEDTGPAAHHMGTTRMGADPAESVVDAELRTHDLSNLSIASSSVFPTAGAMNPTLTIAALALKCADHVETRL